MYVQYSHRQAVKVNITVNKPNHVLKCLAEILCSIPVRFSKLNDFKQGAHGFSKTLVFDFSHCYMVPHLLPRLRLRTFSSQYLHFSMCPSSDDKTFQLHRKKRCLVIFTFIHSSSITTILSRVTVNHPGWYTNPLHYL